jgi:hypothetical protein
MTSCNCDDDDNSDSARSARVTNPNTPIEQRASCEVVYEVPSISVKVRFQRDFRRIQVHTNQSIDHLTSRVFTMFSVSEPVATRLKFLDDEGSWCTLTSDAELTEAIRIALSTPRQILHINLTINDQPRVSSCARDDVLDRFTRTPPNSTHVRYPSVIMHEASIKIADEASIKIADDASIKIADDASIKIADDASIKIADDATLMQPRTLSGRFWRWLVHICDPDATSSETVVNNNSMLHVSDECTTTRPISLRRIPKTLKYKPYALTQLNIEKSGLASIHRDSCVVVDCTFRSDVESTLALDVNDDTTINTAHHAANNAATNTATSIVSNIRASDTANTTATSISSNALTFRDSVCFV